MSLIPNIFGGRRSKDVSDPFEEGLAVPSGARETSVLSNTQINWKETPQAHIFKADLMARIKKEEDKVEVEEVKVLHISGETSKEQEEKNDKPENAKVEEVKASMENGVLTVTVPKMEEKKKPEIKSIHISG